MARFSATTTAAPTTAWALLARPARWHEWAPHVRGGWGLGRGEVEKGARGAARLLGVVPVPVVITDVAPGRSWTWRVGAGPLTVDMDHEVVARRGPRGGCEVAVVLRGRGLLGPVVDAAYGPLVGLLVKRLARVAERVEAPPRDP